MAKRKKPSPADKPGEPREDLLTHGPAWGYWRPGYRDDGSLIRQRRSLSGYGWNFKADPRKDGNR